jgi:hypothetical protein|uniref:Uncharacterized protein n=1 Tax=Desulfobacca acetoxidans TaxID=60893 RepID=A0A7C3Z232_9BACT
MKIEVPADAVQVGHGENGRLAVLLEAEGIEGALMLDPQEFSEDEARELGAMLWRVCERWLAARRSLK